MPFVHLKEQPSCQYWLTVVAYYNLLNLNENKDLSLEDISADRQDFAQRHFLLQKNFAQGRLDKIR